jgi:hypothetical protein
LQASTVAVPLLEEAHGDFEVEEFTQVTATTLGLALGFVIIALVIMLTIKPQHFCHSPCAVYHAHIVEH